MSNDNCGNSGYCNTSGCGNSFDNCGQSVGGVNNFNGFENNSCSDLETIMVALEITAEDSEITMVLASVAEYGH